MVAFAACRVPVAAGIAALAVAGTASAQGEFRESPFFAAADEQRQIVATIEEIETQDGPYSLDLLDPLTALSLLYQEAGDHGLAVAVNERALQVVRANYGLRSLEQAPLIKQQMLNEQARGNAAGAWELEQELLALAGRHPDDLRTVPILREVAERRIDILERYRGGEFPPEIYLGCFYDPRPGDDTGSCYSGSRGVVERSLLRDAWYHYSGAIEVLLRNGLYSSDEVHELEMTLVRSAYEHDGYGVGRSALRRLLAYQVATGAPFLSQIEAFVQLADWDMLFVDQRGAPLDLYEAAYERMKAAGVPQEAIDRLFAPEVPVVLPTFMPNPLAPDETRASAGFIDVEFELTRFGKSRAIEVVGASPDVTHEDEDRLVQVISRSRFRPRISDGELGRTARVAMRYHVPE